jgi:sec-independent protein translocase protein TatC
MIKNLILKLKKKGKTNAQEGMNFLDHLEELRTRIIKMALSIFLCAVPCFIFWRKIFEILLIYPLRYANPKPHLIYTSPAEAVMLSIQIAFVCGIIISIPFIFYQIWAFVSPGLYNQEKKIVLPLVISSSISFFLGLLFAYFVLPLMIRVLTLWGAGAIEPYFKAKEYISFLLKMSLACGIIFEMPVVSWLLTKLDLITPKFLINKLRHAIVVIFIIAAIITPPDVLSQLFLAIPLIFIYLISILVSFLSVEKKK